MRISTVISSALLCAALSGCAGEEPPAPTTDTDLYTDLSRTTTVSGYVIDPEAFYVLSAGWPVDPDDPFGPPPPMLFDGMPFFEFSSVTGANVSLVSGTSQTSSAPSGAKGVWQVFNVPTSSTTTYMARAEPSAAGVQLGAASPFPSPVEVPLGTYQPTVTLRPIVPSVAYCQFMVTTMVGDTGALSALAKARSGTVADLLNPSKTGGVVLAWVYAPSFLLDWVQFPGDQIAVESSAGKVYSLSWAEPGTGGPSQSPMGYMASEGGESPIGYYAIVLPPGSSGPLSVEFVDNGLPSEFDPTRPWFIPPLTADIQPGVVSVARVFAYPGGDEGPPPEEDTDDEPAPITPGNDFGKLCMPPQ